MDRKREASYFLGEILAILPTSLQELRAQCTRQGIEDFPQVETLLSDGTLSSGLHRDWRKAVFRLLDFIFKRFDLPPPQSHSRLDFKLFPVSVHRRPFGYIYLKCFSLQFMSYYFPSILSGLSEGALADPDGTIASDDKKDQAKLILEEILRDIKDREQWSRIEVLTRCLSSFIDQEGVYLKTAALLTVSSL